MVSLCVWSPIHFHRGSGVSRKSEHNWSSERDWKAEVKRLEMEESNEVGARDLGGFVAILVAYLPLTAMCTNGNQVGR